MLLLPQVIEYLYSVVILKNYIIQFYMEIQIWSIIVWCFWGNMHSQEMIGGHSIEFEWLLFSKKCVTLLGVLNVKIIYCFS